MSRGGLSDLALNVFIAESVPAKQSTKGKAAEEPCLCHCSEMKLDLAGALVFANFEYNASPIPVVYHNIFIIYD